MQARNWIRANARALWIIAAVYAALHFLPGLILQPDPSDLERASSRIGWGSALDSDHIARDVHQRVNDERRARGLTHLEWDKELADLARAWSEEMLDSGFRHSPDSFRVHSELQGLGENIAMGQPDAATVHVGWMESDGHRHNLLDPGHTAIGIGIVCRHDGRMWATQIFGRPRGCPGVRGT